MEDKEWTLAQKGLCYTHKQKEGSSLGTLGGQVMTSVCSLKNLGSLENSLMGGFTSIVSLETRDDDRNNDDDNQPQPCQAQSCFTYLTTFNFSNKSMQLVVLLSPFCR